MDRRSHRDATPADDRLAPALGRGLVATADVLSKFTLGILVAPLALAVFVLLYFHHLGARTWDAVRAFCGSA